MSWLDKIKNDLVIITGDKKKYTPLSLNFSFVVDYNTSEFEFVDVPGTLVSKGQPMGTKYNLEIYFQGENHLDTALEFKESCNDKRPWVLTHPFYGELNVQPTSLSFDNSEMNVSKITGTVIETILDDNPVTVVEPLDMILLSKENLDELISNKVSQPPIADDANRLSSENSKRFKLTTPRIKLPEEYDKYREAFEQADSAVNEIVGSAQSGIIAMKAVIKVITMPSEFAMSVKEKIDLLVGQYESLQNNLLFLTGVSSKEIYQAQAVSLISSMCSAAVVPLPGNYTNSNSVLNIMSVINTQYRAFLDDLDSLQSISGGNVNSFIPDPEGLNSLNELVNMTIANLFAIALNSKSERIIELEADSNPIELTHRIYGLDPFDENLNEFIIENDLSSDELFLIKKGRRIVYYI